jgi:hypothetical protein
VKRYTAFVLVFACGFGACWVYRDTQAYPHHEPPGGVESVTDFHGDFFLHDISPDPGGQQGQYHPYMVSVNGKKHRIEATPEGEVLYLLKLDGGRIEIHARRIPNERVTP